MNARKGKIKRTSKCQRTRTSLKEKQARQQLALLAVDGEGEKEPGLVKEEEIRLTRISERV